MGTLDMSLVATIDGPRARPAEGRTVAVRIRGAKKSFGSGEQTVWALRGVDWDVYAGQMTLLTGPSGCGKTTLLSVIAGILNPTEGEVDVFGTVISKLSDSQKTRYRARNIGFVFQAYNLLPALTAAENAAIPLVIAGWKRERAVKRAADVLASLGMGTKIRSLPTQLSGGQQQRVAIARALAHEPRLLVCDEPTAALDHETGGTVMQLLRDSAVRPDRAVVVVTHDNRVFHFADRTGRMDDGHLVQVTDRDGPTAAVTGVSGGSASSTHQPHLA